MLTHSVVLQPAKQCNENEGDYYRRVFALRDNSEKSLKEFYEDVFCEYKGESQEEYVKRIDKVFKYLSTVDCRVNSSRSSYLDKYYKYKYAKRSGENDQEFFERTLVKKSESSSQYKSRAELMKKFVQSVDWSKVTIEESSKTGFTIKSKSSTETRDSSSCKVGELSILHPMRVIY